MKITSISKSLKIFSQLKSHYFVVKTAAEGYPGMSYALQISLEQWMLEDLRSSIRGK